MTMHMWVREGERRKPRNCIRWISSRGGGRETGSVWIRAQTSRPPRGEGGYGGPLKHSMFGNQVLNVSGSRDDHPGNGVKTICFMAQNTAIIYIHFVQGKMMVSDVNSRKSLRPDIISDRTAIIYLHHWNNSVPVHWAQNSVDEIGLKAAEEA